MGFLMQMRNCGADIGTSTKLGPFTQDVIKDGVLIRIEGKDKSAHAIIEESDGNTWSF
ncbi:MAG TPA: hypothetical protein ACQGQG_05155 [Xylella sp.]